MGINCPHIYKPGGLFRGVNYKQRGEELRKIIKQIRKRTFDYDDRKPEKTNWTKYDQAQIHEFADFLDNVREVVNEAERRITGRSKPKKKGPGRPPISPSDITKALLVQTYTHSPNRVAEGLLLLFREKLGISQHFSYKTIERGYDREPVNEILDEVNRILNGTVEGIEANMSAFKPLSDHETKTLILNGSYDTQIENKPLF